MTCIYPSDLDFRRSNEAFRRFGEEAEIALMAWDSDVALMQSFTTDRSFIEDKIGNKVGFFRVLNPDAFNSGPYIVVRPERTHYRPGEAIYQAVKYLEKAGSRERRKIIIIISWATPPLLMADTHRQSASIVTESLEKTGTTVYGLYITEDGERGFRNSGKRRNGGTIEQFVEYTVGSILIGKREEVDSLFIKLADLIRSSYTIGYYPEDSSFDGRFRRISVELSSQGKTKAGKVDIKTKAGYRALRPSFPTAVDREDINNR
jgi:VWFA-related protein